MGGTMEISGLNSPLLIKRAQAIYNGAKAYYPDLPVDVMPAEKIWYGLRPLTPDGLPYIGGHSKYANLVIAGGHAMLGLSLAAGTGKLVEELISKKKPSVDVKAFAPERF
jgi:D-amino-acid dehydrogenase